MKRLQSSALFLFSFISTGKFSPVDLFLFIASHSVGMRLKRAIVLGCFNELAVRGHGIDVFGGLSDIREDDNCIASSSFSRC